MLKDYCKESGVLATDVARFAKVPYSTLSYWYNIGRFDLLDNAIRKVRVETALYENSLSRFLVGACVDTTALYREHNRKTVERWWRNGDYTKVEELVEKFKKGVK